MARELEDYEAALESDARTRRRVLAAASSIVLALAVLLVSRLL